MRRLLFLFAILLCAVPSRATSYFLAPASGGGADTNNGTSSGTPWLSPNHALNCGDIITAAAGTYSAANFASSKWGAVTCPSNNNVAWLICATFDACKISASGTQGMYITANYWGVQGWEVTATGTNGSCFLARPPTSSATIHHIIFANDIANGCQNNGFNTINNGSASVDYIVMIGNIAYNAAAGSSECYSGFSIYQPQNKDTNSGTHIYVAGNFSWSNLDPNPCAGTTPTDGEGIIFDTFDGDQGGIAQYTQQAVMYNNIVLHNGGRGIYVVNNRTGSTHAPIFMEFNTAYGDNTDTNQSSTWCGDADLVFAKNVTVSNNLVMTATANGCGANPNYAYFNGGGDNTDVINGNWGYSAAGHNCGLNSSGSFSCGTNTFSNPSFTSTTIPGAPSCGSATSVPNCMATVISNFTPTTGGSTAYGYQAVSNTSITDALYPPWLCNVTIPQNLVTPGCGPPPLPPTISPLLPIVSAGGATQTFTCAGSCGTGGTWSVANTGQGGALGSINSSTGVYTPPATLAAPQSFAGYQLLPPDHVYNTNISGLSARAGGASFTISTLTRTANVATATFSPATTLAIGTPITISGVTDATYDCTLCNVTAAGGGQVTVSYASTGANGSSSGGSMLVPWASGMGTTTVNFLPSFPVNYVNASTPTSAMSFTYTPLNNTTFSIPTCPTLNVESGCGGAIANDNGVDHHGLFIRTDTGVVSEFYQINNGLSCWTGTCTSQGGAQYNYYDYGLPGGGNGTSDAGGLGMAPLLLHTQELNNACTNGTAITHAGRMTMGGGYLTNAFIWPATTSANEPGINPYGQRYRLKAAYSIGSYSACAQIILTWLKNYGVFLADGGTGFQISVDYDAAIPSVFAALNSITAAAIPVTNWEPVDESSLEESATSGATTTGEIVTYTSSTGTASTNVDLQGTALSVQRNQEYIAASTPQQLLTVWSNSAFTCAMSPTEGSITQNSSGCLYTAPGSVGTNTDTTITVTSSADNAVTAVIFVHILPLNNFRITEDTANFTDHLSNVWYAGSGATLGYGLSGSPRWNACCYNNTNITGTDKQLFWNGYYISGISNDYKIDVRVPNGNYTFTFNNGTSGAAVGTAVRNFYIQGSFLGAIDSVGLVGNNAQWSLTQNVTVSNNTLSFYQGGVGNQANNGSGLSSFSIQQNNTTVPTAPASKGILLQ